VVDSLTDTVLVGDRPVDTERRGTGRGSSHHRHGMFPRGGPQRQGNRLAGLLRTQGEH
jgi:tRNA 2-thiouridine synthesizing protein E